MATLIVMRVYGKRDNDHESGIVEVRARTNEPTKAYSGGVNQQTQWK